MIETTRLNLIPFNENHFKALFAKDMALLGFYLDVQTPETWSTFEDAIEALPFFYESYQKHLEPWSSFFAVHRADRFLLGTCGYKFPPDTEGVVEIGYEVHADYRRQGLATEIAQCLTDFAFEHPEVNIVRAHTLAVANPSVLVLKKVGFQFVATVTDPDDGDLWRWELPRPLTM
jgi:[ribosomal protein S5]-alanine N-acetyltransferase